MVVATDLEGTLTTGSSAKGLANYLQTSSQAASYQAFVRARLPNYIAAQIGWQDKENFRSCWQRDLIGLFTGQSQAEFAKIAEWVVEHELWPKRREDVLAALKVHQAAHETLLLASATYSPILKAFAERIKVDDAIGTDLELSKEYLTGKLGGRINTKNVKAQRLHAYLKDSHLYAAYGDTEADVPMLMLADTAVAVYPDRGLRRTATALGWKVLE